MLLSAPFKLQMPSCDDCGKTLQKPFVCLECVFAGCWRNAHIVDHLEKTGHDFGMSQVPEKPLNDVTC